MGSGCRSCRAKGQHTSGELKRICFSTCLPVSSLQTILFFNAYSDTAAA